MGGIQQHPMDRDLTQKDPEVVAQPALGTFDSSSEEEQKWNEHLDSLLRSNWYCC
jgi:hypothetical protein